jgi:hypothetical protein
MKKLLSILIIGASLNFAHAQDDLSRSIDAQEVRQFVNNPQNTNDKLNNPQGQNDAELVMFIMKSIEDKHIKEIDKKIEFVNSFNASNSIKEQAISLINQGITYSDNEKVSYGVYLLKKCHDSTRSPRSRIDYRPFKGNCVYERSNIC